MSLRAAFLTLLGLMAFTATPLAYADDLAQFRIEMADGRMTPTELTVPANKPIRLILVNRGKTPAEFENTELHKEKVLAAGSESFLVLRNLAPGKYRFFDDFHPSAYVVIEAK